jgi:NosR/NirI family nitrous oxide reductase transcriptional regulator
MISVITKIQRSVMRSGAGVASLISSVPLRRIGLILVIVMFSGAVLAQYQKAPPDFGNTYSFPTPEHPEPRADWLRLLDVVVLAAALGLSSWLVLKCRSRNGVLLLSLGALAYFGFFRKGCVCPIGAIQNVTLSLVDSRYLISMGVILFFFLPLVAALLFGRVFCGSVCPHGAIQDLVLLRPVKVPEKLGWGLHLHFGAWQIDVGKRFLLCEWDPFVGLFRISGPFHMLAIGAGFILLGIFVGRPYCRWLCPYGAILGILSRFAWKNVRITPNKELDCGLCSDACPYGAIRDLRADRATCVACARCFESCPRHRQLHAAPRGDGSLVQVQ